NLGPVAARVTRASVRWSVDGSHWHAARLTRTDKNTFRVSYRDPAATTAHPYLSLEVSARDAAGRAISESVHHAYALPRGSSRARPAGATSAAAARSRAAQGRPPPHHAEQAPLHVLRQARPRRSCPVARLGRGAQGLGGHRPAQRLRH